MAFRNDFIDSLSIPTDAGPGIPGWVFTQDIPQELIDYYAPTGITLAAVQISYPTIVDEYLYIGIGTGGVEVRGIVDTGVVRETSRWDNPGVRTRLWFGWDVAQPADIVVGPNSGTGSCQLQLQRGSTLSLLSTSKMELSSVLCQLVTRRGEAEANANLTLATGAGVLVPGCTFSLTPARSNPEFEAEIVCDFDETVAGTSLCVGELFIDGVQFGTKAALLGVAATTDRGTVSQFYSGTLSGAGPFTFALRARRSAAAGTQVANATHTSIRAKLLEGLV